MITPFAAITSATQIIDKYIFIQNAYISCLIIRIVIFGYNLVELL